MKIRKIAFALFGLCWFGVAVVANADCNQGCDANLGTTYFGQNTTDFGFANTAFGASALAGNTSGYSNTAIGWEALMVATATDDDTAVGFATLQSATGADNTAIGSGALTYDTTGNSNTATGATALLLNTTGNNNTANGTFALQSNEDGSSNTAVGMSALISNSSGNYNLANGASALYSNTIGNSNVANGYEALFKSTGSSNTATGYLALNNITSGANNIGVGASAGTNLTTGSNNIDIGASGISGDSNTIRIGKQNTQTAAYIQGISGATVASGVGVMVSSSGHLGTINSSARYKENIHPMDKASEAILSLRPVSFRYKKELDPQGIRQFGLVAEEVEKVDPNLVARDGEGKSYSVRYEAINAMLLNEFLKEHRRVEAQARTIAAQAGSLKDERDEIAQLKSALGKQRQSFESRAGRQEQEIATLERGLKRVSERLENSAAALVAATN